MHEVVTFGAPMVGNAAAAEAFARELPNRVFRYVDVEAVSHHYSTEATGKINDHGENSIPLAYYAFGAGVAYAF